MLDHRQSNDLQVSKPKESPSMVEIDWNAWGEAVDKRIQEHLAKEEETIVDAVGDAMGTLRRELYEDDKFRGPPGRPGADAKLPRVKLWREDTVYYEGDCVAFGGSLYQAQCDTGKSPLFAKHWMCLATAGVDGRPIRHRGTFDPKVEYREHDAVLVDGGSFVALRDDPEHRCPGEKIQNTLMLNDEIEAHEKKINPATNGVPDLRNGEQRLDVRFIQFDNMVLELLHYRENKEPMGTGAAWAPAHEHR